MSLSKIEKLRAKLAEAEMREAVKTNPAMKAAVAAVHAIDRAIEKSTDKEDLHDSLVAARENISAGLHDLGIGPVPARAPRKPKPAGAPPPKLRPRKAAKQA